MYENRATSTVETEREAQSAVASNAIASERATKGAAGRATSLKKRLSKRALGAALATVLVAIGIAAGASLALGEDDFDYEHSDTSIDSFYTSGLHLDSHAGPELYKKKTGKDFSVKVTTRDSRGDSSFANTTFGREVETQTQLDSNQAYWLAGLDGRRSHFFEDASCASIWFKDFDAARNAKLVVDYPYIGDYNEREVGAKVTITNIVPYLRLAAAKLQSDFDWGIEHPWDNSYDSEVYASHLMQPALQIADQLKHGIYFENIHRMDIQLEFYYIDNQDNRDAGLVGQPLQREDGGAVKDIYLTMSSLSLWKDSTINGSVFVSEKVKPLSDVSESYILETNNDNNTTSHIYKTRREADADKYSTSYDQYYPFVPTLDEEGYSERLRTYFKSIEGDASSFTTDTTDGGWYSPYRMFNVFNEAGEFLPETRPLKDVYVDTVGDYTFPRQAASMLFENGNDVRFAVSSTGNTMWFTIYPAGLTNMSPRSPILTDNSKPHKAIFSNDGEQHFPQKGGFGAGSEVEYVVEQQVNTLDANSIVRYDSLVLEDKVPDEIEIESYYITKASVSIDPDTLEEVLGKEEVIATSTNPLGVGAFSRLTYDGAEWVAAAGDVRAHWGRTGERVDDNGNVVRFTFSPEYLSTMEMAGEHYFLHIKGKVKSSATVGTPLFNAGAVYINNAALDYTKPDNYHPTNVLDEEVLSELKHQEVTLASRDEQFTYAISQLVPEDADRLYVVDTLEDVFEVVGTPRLVHKVTDPETGARKLENVEGATVSVSPQAVSAGDGRPQKVEANLADEVSDGGRTVIKNVTNVRGETLTLMFDVKLRDGLADEDLIAYSQGKSVSTFSTTAGTDYAQEVSSGKIPNIARVNFTHNPDGGSDTNQVDVIPPFDPEKAIIGSSSASTFNTVGGKHDGEAVTGTQKGVHVDTGKVGDTWTYAISQAIPSGVSTITVTDELSPFVQFVSSHDNVADDIEVVFTDKNDVQHTPKPSEVAASIAGNNVLTITVENPRKDASLATISDVVAGPNRYYAKTSEGTYYSANSNPFEGWVKVDETHHDEYLEIAKQRMRGDMADTVFYIRDGTDGEDRSVLDDNVLLALLAEVAADEAHEYDGCQMTVRFKAKFQDGKTLSEIGSAYTSVGEPAETPLYTHSGIANQASVAFNSGTPRTTNKVTVTPPSSKDVRDDNVGDGQLGVADRMGKDDYRIANRDDVFTYGVERIAPANVASMLMYDSLEPVLELAAPAADHVRVYVRDANVLTWTALNASDYFISTLPDTADESRQVVQVSVGNLNKVANKIVRFEFDAKIRSSATPEQLDAYLDNTHNNEIDNTADVRVNGNPSVTNTVKVTPPPEKHVYANREDGSLDSARGNAGHTHLDLVKPAETYTYTITERFADDASVQHVTISDVLERVLEFAGDTYGGLTVTTTEVGSNGSTSSTALVAGRDFTIASTPGTDRKGAASNNGFTVKFSDSGTDGRSVVAGKRVTITFKAKVKDGADLSAYTNGLIDNDATVNVSNSYTATTNPVTVTPPPDKEILAIPESDSRNDDRTKLAVKYQTEPYLYRITDRVSENATQVVMEDTLNYLLELVGTDGDLKVYYGNDPANEVGRDVSYAYREVDFGEAGTHTATRLTVTVRESYLSMVRGKPITFEFKAHVRPGLNDDDLEPYIGQNKDGIPNTASVDLGGGPRVTQTVHTVTPGKIDLLIAKSTTNSNNSERFRFQITLRSYDNATEMNDVAYVYDYQVWNADDYDMTANAGKQGKAFKRVGTVASGGIIELAGGELAVVKNLHVGIRYNVKELDSDHYTVVAPGEQGGQLADGDAPLLRFVNEPKPGELEMKKVVTRPSDNGDDPEFAFDVYLRDGTNPVTGNRTYTLTRADGTTAATGTVSFARADAANPVPATATRVGGDLGQYGYAQIKLKANETVKIEGLNAGTYYQVWEADVNDNWVNAARSNNVGVIPSGTAALVAITNEPTSEPSKTVNGRTHVTLTNRNEVVEYKVSYFIPTAPFEAAGAPEEIRYEFKDQLEDCLELVTVENATDVYVWGSDAAQNKGLQNSDFVTLTYLNPEAVEGSNPNLTVPNASANVEEEDGRFTVSSTFTIKKSDLEGLASSTDPTSAQAAGHMVTMTFQARIKSSVSDADLINRYGITTVKNTGTVKVGNDREKETNPVFITPPPVKNVDTGDVDTSKAKTDAILAARDKTFTYTVSQTVPGNATSVLFEDTFEDVLECVRVEGEGDDATVKEFDDEYADLKDRLEEGTPAYQQEFFTLMTKYVHADAEWWDYAEGATDPTKHENVSVAPAGAVVNGKTLAVHGSAAGANVAVADENGLVTVDDKTYLVLNADPDQFDMKVEGQKLSMKVSGANAVLLRNKHVAVSYLAKIRDRATERQLQAYVNNQIPNVATVTINDQPLTTNEVDVVPAPFKEVTTGDADTNETKTHADLSNARKEFTYDVKDKVPTMATKVTMYDTLDELLEFSPGTGSDAERASVKVEIHNNTLAGSELEDGDYTVTYGDMTQVGDDATGTGIVTINGKKFQWTNNPQGASIRVELTPSGLSKVRAGGEGSVSSGSEIDFVFKARIRDLVDQDGDTDAVKAAKAQLRAELHADLATYGGVRNQGSIDFGRGGRVTNVVTVAPPPEKAIVVASETAADADEPGTQGTFSLVDYQTLKARDEVVTYRITDIIGADASKVVFDDDLESVLELVRTEGDAVIVRSNDASGTVDKFVEVKLVDPKDSTVDSIVLNPSDYTADVTDANIHLEFKDIDGKSVVAGKQIEVTFKARIRATATTGQLERYVIAKNGVQNSATVTIGTSHRTTNEVVIIPPPRKQVNGKLHEHLANLGDEFTYTVTDVIPTDGSKVVFTDVLDDLTDLVGDDGDITVTTSSSSYKKGRVTVDGAVKQAAATDAEFDVAVTHAESTADNAHGRKSTAITVTMRDVDVDGASESEQEKLSVAAGHAITFTFKVKLKDTSTMTAEQKDQFFEDLRVHVIEDKGVKNRATVQVNGHTPRISNEVSTATPPEKKVTAEHNQAASGEPVTADNMVDAEILQSKDELFTYTITDTLDKDATDVYLVDELEPELEMVTLGSATGSATVLAESDLQSQNVDGEAVYAFRNPGAFLTVQKRGEGAGAVTENVPAADYVALFDPETNTLRIKFFDEGGEDGVSKIAGTTLTVRFKAQIKDGTNVNDLDNFQVENDAEIRLADHDPKVTNKVYVSTPPEKDVEGETHHEVSGLADSFTYTITDHIPAQSTDVKLVDTLVPELQLVGDDYGLKVVVDGVTIAPGRYTATVDYVDDEDSAVAASAAGARQRLTVKLADDLRDRYANGMVSLASGRELKISFKARIKAGADITKYFTTGKHGIPNVGHVWVRTTDRPTNGVTVMPPPEKYVENQKDPWALKSLGDAFTYKIVQAIPDHGRSGDQAMFEFTDTLEPVIQFAKGEGDSITRLDNDLSGIKDVSDYVNLYLRWVSYNADGTPKEAYRVTLDPNAPRVTYNPANEAHFLDDARQTGTVQVDGVTVPLKEKTAAFLAEDDNASYDFSIVESDDGRQTLTLKADRDAAYAMRDRYLEVEFKAVVREGVDLDDLKDYVAEYGGIPNIATVNVGHGPKPTNEVLVTPPPKKFVDYDDGGVYYGEHADLIERDSVYSYIVEDLVPANASKVVMTDELKPELQFEKRGSGSTLSASDIGVWCSSDRDPLKPGTDYTASFATAETNGSATTSVDKARFVRVALTSAGLQKVKGDSVRFVFFASIRPDASDAALLAYANYKIPNTAKMDLGTTDEPRETNEVTVTPPPVKHVDTKDADTNTDKTHADLSAKGKVFTYTITDKIPDDVSGVTINDYLQPALEYADAAGNVVNRPVVSMRVENDNGTKRADLAANDYTVTTDWYLVDDLYGYATPVSSSTPNARHGMTVVLTESGLEKAKGYRISLDFTAVFSQAEAKQDALQAALNDGKGVPNQAEVVFADDEYGRLTNIVTVTPPPDKLVEGALTYVMDGADDTFTYSISDYIPANATTVVMTDDLHHLLEPVKKDDGTYDVSVTTARGTFNANLYDVKFEEGVTGNATFPSRLTVTVARKATGISQMAGDKVTFNFEAKVRSNLSDDERAELRRYVVAASDDPTKGIENTAKVAISGHDPRITNEVYVTPDDQTPPEKTVEGTLTYALPERFDVFEYAITRAIDANAHDVTMVDELKDILAVADHDEDGSITLADVEAVDAEGRALALDEEGSSIQEVAETDDEGQPTGTAHWELKLALAKQGSEANALSVGAGKTVTFRFWAQVRPGTTAKDLAPYMTDVENDKLAVIDNVAELNTDIDQDPHVYTNKVTVTTEVNPDPAELELQARKRFTDDGRAATGGLPLAASGSVAAADGTPKALDIEENAFTFKLFDDKGELLETKTTPAATAPADSVVKFSAITYDKAGVYRYSIQEDPGEKPDPQIRYDSVAHLVSVLVTLDEDEMKYVATPVYSNADENGNLVIVNQMLTPPSTLVTLEATKSLSGATLRPGQFQFKLTPDAAAADATADEGTVVYNGHLGNAGRVVFPDLAFTADDAGKTFTYTMQEVAEDEQVKALASQGYSFDETMYRAQIAVTLDEQGGGSLGTQVTYFKIVPPETEGGEPSYEPIDGLPAFANAYEPDEYEVDLSKVDASTSKELPGAGLELRDADGKLVESWTSAAEPHKVKVGAGTYTMYEVTVPEGYLQAAPITFTVADDGTVTGTTTMPDPVKPNSPDTPDPITLTLEASKLLDGKVPATEQFSFRLVGLYTADADGKAADANDYAYVKTVANDGQGKVTFAGISLPKAGAYTFHVSEVAGTDDSIVYDTSSYDIAVTVTESDGELQCSVAYPGGEKPEFRNTTKPSTPSTDKPTTTTGTPSGTPSSTPTTTSKGTPTRTTTSTSSGKSTGASVTKTGDQLQTAALAVGAVAALAAVAAVVAVRRYRRRDR